MEKNAYQIIKSHYITEKTTVLEGLAQAEGNVSLSRCKTPKYVFIVDGDANKEQIAEAIEEIYKDRDIRVTAVNTMWTKRKSKRMGRKAREGQTTAQKKAIVSLRPEDSLEDI